MIPSHRRDFPKRKTQRRCPQSALCAGRSWSQPEHGRLFNALYQGPGKQRQIMEQKSFLPDARFSMLAAGWNHPGNLKTRTPRLHPRPITSASLEVDQKAGFLNTPVTLVCGQGFKLGCMHGSQTSGGHKDLPEGLFKTPIPGPPPGTF